MSSEVVLKVENVGKRYEIYEAPHHRLLQTLLRGRKQFYKEFWALKDVSFDVKKGECLGIIGRNGCGKSTLLQIIAGTLAPTTGSVSVTGKVAALLELGSGFNMDFTGRENVYMNGAIMGLSRAEMDQKFDEIAAFADIGEFIDQPVKIYSSGMMVRLAFAISAVIDPDILVVDEALAVGDEKFQRKCFARLEELKSRDSAILFVSHSPASVIEFCDKTLLLDYGERLMFDQAPKAVRAYQKLIYAPVEHQKKLAQEYRVADQAGDAVEDDFKDELEIISGEHSSDGFDPGLVPETTTVYPLQGAEIDSIRILDVKKRTVNVLQPGGNYQFVVSGHFLTNFAGIFWGIHIRSISGVVITGQRYPEEGKYVEHVCAGKNFKICFSFRMDVLPGVYFVGGGIWSSQEPNCVHRILDAIMFRVLPEEKNMSFGYFNAAVREPALEVF